MPQFVSKNHKMMMVRLREMFPSVVGWPDAEVNLGHLAGMSDVNLRADAFIRIDDDRAVCIEWQSEIHTEEGCKNNEWFDYNEIAGRDNLKRQLCAKTGIALVELWTLDVSDQNLKEQILAASESSNLSDQARRALGGTKKQAFEGTGTGFGKNDSGFGSEKPEWKHGDPMVGTNFFKNSKSSFGKSSKW